jgi:hypothetical protein
MRRRHVFDVLSLLLVHGHQDQPTGFGEIDPPEIDHAHPAVVLGVVIHHSVFCVIAGGPDRGVAHPGG